MQRYDQPVLVRLNTRDDIEHLAGLDDFNLLLVEQLREHFPGARFVISVRHPLATAERILGAVGTVA